MITHQTFSVFELAHQELETIVQTRESLKKYNQKNNTDYSFHPDYGQLRFIQGILMPEPQELCDLLGIKTGEGLQVVEERELENLHEVYDRFEECDIRYKAKSREAVGLCLFRTWQDKKTQIHGNSYTVYKGILFVE